VLAVPTVAVAPLPVLALVSTWQPAVLAVRTMRFDDPVIVITNLRIVPDVVIAVVGIIDAITNADMGRAAGQQGCGKKAASEQNSSQTRMWLAHALSIAGKRLQDAAAERVECAHNLVLERVPAVFHHASAIDKDIPHRGALGAKQDGRQQRVRIGSGKGGIVQVER
jgi:hypothetical protein